MLCYRKKSKAVTELLYYVCIYQFVILFSESTYCPTYCVLIPTALAQVRSQVCSSGICGGQSGPGVGFFSENFGFPCQSSFHQILHHIYPGQARIGQSVAAVLSGPSWTPRPTNGIKKKKLLCSYISKKVKLSL
jgi:hypothetical protein